MQYYLFLQCCSDYVTILTLQTDFISYKTANYVTLVTMLHIYITYYTTSLTYGTFNYLLYLHYLQCCF